MRAPSWPALQAREPELALGPGPLRVQVAGLRYSFDARKPTGSRIINALVNTTAGWVPAAHLDDITLITTNYVGTTGGDG